MLCASLSGFTPGDNVDNLHHPHHPTTQLHISNVRRKQSKLISFSMLALIRDSIIEKPFLFYLKLSPCLDFFFSIEGEIANIKLV